MQAPYGLNTDARTRISTQRAIEEWRNSSSWLGKSKGQGSWFLTKTMNDDVLIA